VCDVTVPHSPGHGSTGRMRPTHTCARGTRDPAPVWTGHTADPPRAAGSGSPEPRRARSGNTPAEPGPGARLRDRGSAPSYRGETESDPGSAAQLVPNTRLFR